MCKFFYIVVIVKCKSNDWVWFIFFDDNVWVDKYVISLIDWVFECWLVICRFFGLEVGEIFYEIGFLMFWKFKWNFCVWFKGVGNFFDIVEEFFWNLFEVVYIFFIVWIWLICLFLGSFFLIVFGFIVLLIWFCESFMFGGRFDCSGCCFGGFWDWWCWFVFFFCCCNLVCGRVWFFKSFVDIVVNLYDSFCCCFRKYCLWLVEICCVWFVILDVFFFEFFVELFKVLSNCWDFGFFFFN